MGLGSGEFIFTSERERGVDSVSERVYLFILGLYVVGGLALSALVASKTYDSWADMSIWVVLGVGLLIPIAGIFISVKSDNWAVSTVGYLMVVVPFGALVGPFAAQYDFSVVVDAMLITLGLTAVLWIVGMIAPPIMKDLSGSIVVVLVALIVAMLVFSTSIWWSWVAVLLFSGLIVYDVNRAMQLPRTLDNAVDSAVGIYLDIINLFLHILRLMGGGGKK